MTCRKDLLGRYSVLSAQFHILLEEFNRKDSIMFPSLAIYPKKTIPENPNHSALPRLAALCESVRGC